MKATLLTESEALTWTKNRCSVSAYMNRPRDQEPTVLVTAMDSRGLGVRLNMSIEEARRLQAQLDILKLGT